MCIRDSKITAVGQRFRQHKAETFDQARKNENVGPPHEFVQCAFRQPWPDSDAISGSLSVFPAVGRENKIKRHIRPVYSPPRVNQMMQPLSRAVSNEQEPDRGRRATTDPGLRVVRYILSL